ncbi:MAG: hypothetical protein AABZ55_15450 [Bdellovibrionota bacterium]
MSSRLISIVFVLLLYISQSSAFSNELKNPIGDFYIHSTKEERLAHRMHKFGVRHFLGNEGVAHLSPLAEDHSKKLDLGCEVTGYWEIYLQKGNTNFPVGFEVTLDCNDAPTPGLALYFDLDDRFLGSFDFGH